MTIPWTELDWIALDRRHVWHPYTQMKTAPPPLPIARCVRGHREQPAAQVRGVTPGLQMPQELEKRLLHDILGVLAAAGEPVGDVKHILRVALDERLEGVSVTAANLCDGTSVALVHPLDIDG